MVDAYLTGEFRYVRVAKLIREAIVKGKHKQGDRLPSQHELAKSYGVAFNTLKQALDLLERDGYISRILGRGTFVADPESQKPSVLIVDDESAIRKLLVRSVGPLGVRATTAKDGNEAIEKFSQDRFDLVLLDLVMPGLDGVETLRRIKEINPKVSVVIITGYPDSELLDQALSIGPFAVMRKPFSQDDIQSAVRLYCGRRDRNWGRSRLVERPLADLASL